jgi:membrane protein
MDSSAKRGKDAENCCAVSKAQPGDSRIDRRNLALIKYFDGFLRSPFTVWMSLVATLGWILRRLVFKRQNVYRVDDQKGRRYHSKEVARIPGGKKKGLTIFSMGIELSVAVGMNLLKNHVKSWKTALKPRREDLASQKPYPADIVQQRDPIVENLPDNVKREKSCPAPAPSTEAVWFILKTTATQWINDKCPQLGAALAYFTVFSLAPLVLILLAFFGLFFGSQNARDKIIEQLQFMIDPSGIKVIKEIAASVSKPQSSILATTLGIIVGLFGASGVFGQLQDALNTIWGVKAKPGASLWAFIRARFLSFAMVAGVCFLLLVSLTIESVLRGLSNYLQNLLPGGHILALVLFLILDFGVVIVLFAMIFRFLPDIKIGWRDVWIGASLTAVLFVVGKFILGLYLGSGAAGSAYGAASSLITLLLWIYYSAQILLFGAEFTQVYTHTYGSRVEPEDHAVRVKRLEVEVPTPETEQKMQRDSASEAALS